MYRHGGDRKQLADALGTNIKTTRSIAATDREMPKQDDGSKKKKPQGQGNELKAIATNWNVTQRKASSLLL